MRAALDADTVARRLAGLPAEIAEIRLLILIGSVAKGRNTPSSDIDLGVLCDREADLDALFLALAPRLETDRLDIVDLRHASPLIAFEVARTGKLIFERTRGAFRQFQSLAYRRYCDTERDRRMTKRRIQLFLEREGLR